MIEEELKKRKEIKKFIIIATPKDGKGQSVSFFMSSNIYDIHDAAQKEVDKIMWDTWPRKLDIIEESMASKVNINIGIGKDIKVEADIDLYDSSERTFGLAYR